MLCTASEFLKPFTFRMGVRAWMGPCVGSKSFVEALSFLLRKSIQIAVDGSTVENFKDDSARRAYFAPLTKTKLLRRRDVVNFLTSQNSPVSLSDILVALNAQLTTRAPKPFNLDQIRNWVSDAVASGQVVCDAKGNYKTP